ncbi:MAG TPA: hypothetical protein VGS41_07940, partial [Chthonomonadales bacterium]|nr:hypothetical protein [Chthonomonadales bacterium]
MAVRTVRSDRTVSAVWRLLLRLVVIGLILFVCYQLRALITALFVASVIAYILDPAVEVLCGWEAFVKLHAGALMAINESLERVARAWQLDTHAAYRRKPYGRHFARVCATCYVFIAASIGLWQGTRLIVSPFVAEVRAAASPNGRKAAAEHKDRLLRWYDSYAPGWAKSARLERQVLNSDLPATMRKSVSRLAQRVLDSVG